MDPFIQEFKDTLSIDLCKDIILRYDTEQNKYEGVTSGGLDKQIKDTTDYKVNLCPDSELWKEIDKQLYDILQIYIFKYVNTIDELYFGNSGYKFFKKNIFSENGFQLQRYKKGIGKFIYHNDFSVDYLHKRYRAIVYIWYLNTVDEGGETEFLGGKYSVKPECGKLVMFPATWTYPHSGKIPISSDKYIITGWFYVEENSFIYDTISEHIKTDTKTNYITLKSGPVDMSDQK